MNSPTAKLPYVDMLRGIAILMVVMVHTAFKVAGLDGVPKMLVDYGQTGVQLFFVVSAFTLCASYVKSDGRPLQVTSFYLRRFFRIAPLYYIGIALYLTIEAATQLHRYRAVVDMEPYTFTNVAANVFFVHGLVPSANNDIVPGGWSIGTEMLFYLIFPALFTVSRRIAERFGSTSVVAILIAAVGLNIAAQACIAAAFGVGIVNNEFLYYSLLNQLPVFVVGILAHLFTRDGDARTSRTATLLFGTGFLVLTAAALFVWFGVDAAGRFAFIPVISGLSYGCLLMFLRALNWTSRPLERIGQLSYSIYIFHFVAAWYVVPFLLARFEHQLNPVSRLLISFPLALGLSVLAAMVTEKYVEAKGIQAGSELIARLRRRAASADR